MTDSDVNQVLRRLDTFEKQIAKLEFAVAEATLWQTARDLKDREQSIRLAERMRILRGILWLSRQDWVRYAGAVGTAVILQRWLS